MGAWIRTSKRRLCPICGANHYCGISADGEIVHCMNEPADWKCSTGGGGWFHRLIEAPDRGQFHRHRRTTPPPAPELRIDCDAILAAWVRSGGQERVDVEADVLGLTGANLRILGATWASDRDALAFPMYDSDENVVGIRLRATTGDKWAVTGSKAGVFLPAGRMSDIPDVVLVCEGPTDTAALLDLGFYAIGRPSCLGQEDLVGALVCGRNVVIVADRDDPKTRRDGSTWYPGEEGATQLANTLLGHGHVKAIKVIKPPAPWKDARAWKRGGATHAIVQAVIQNMGLWARKEK